MCVSLNHVTDMSAWTFVSIFLLYLSVEGASSDAHTLSYRSDGPNIEYKSLRKLELTPYVMGDGTWYRDMLTIEASRAVGQFAQKFHNFPQNNVSLPALLAIENGNEKLKIIM